MSVLLGLGLAANIAILASTGFTISYTDRMVTTGAWLNFDMAAFVVAGIVGAATATAVPVLGLVLSWRVNRAASLGGWVNRRIWLAAILAAAALLLFWSVLLLPRFAGSWGSTYGIYPWLRMVVVLVSPFGAAVLVACAVLARANAGQLASARSMFRLSRAVFWTCLAWAILMLAMFAMDFLFVLWWSQTGHSM
jgi:hypothetical protein